MEEFSHPGKTNLKFLHLEKEMSLLEPRFCLFSSIEVKVASFSCSARIVNYAMNLVECKARQIQERDESETDELQRFFDHASIKTEPIFSICYRFIDIDSR